MTGNVVRATWSDPRHHPLSACPSSVPSGRGVPVAAAVLRACSRARPCSTWASGRLRGLAASSGLRGHPAKRRTTSRFLGASVGLEKIHLLVGQRIRHAMPSTPSPPQLCWQNHGVPRATCPMQRRPACRPQQQHVLRGWTLLKSVSCLHATVVHTSSGV